VRRAPSVSGETASLRNPTVLIFRPVASGVRTQCECDILAGVSIAGAHFYALTGGVCMKFAGFLLLLTGWLLVLAAIVLLASPPPRAGFVLAGVAVEVLGLTLVIRSHLILHEDKR
jgi:hypothetical protein